MVLGCHGLISVGGGLAILKDYPSEHASLLKEIEEAKSYYQKKGISI